MSAQIDIITECREPGQGSCVRVEEIAKASTPALDNRYRFAARSVKVTWRLCTKSSLRPLADELETKAKVKNLFARLLLLACGGLGDLSLGNIKVFCFDDSKISRVTAIDIPYKITIYKKVIIIARKEDICDFWLLVVR
jgi:hypothetical protein